MLDHTETLLDARVVRSGKKQLLRLCFACALRKQEVQNKMVFWVPNRTQGCMVDALTLRGDEGRGVAAISSGEACSNL